MVTVIANWFILRQFCTFMYFIFFGTLCQLKSGNTGQLYIDGLSMDEVSFAQGFRRPSPRTNVIRQSRRISATRCRNRSIVCRLLFYLSSCQG
jgi:hypothetical protein